MEGEMLRKAGETKLKKYWYCMLGKELYVYKNKDDDRHRGMHNLNGVFIRDELPESYQTETIYPFTLIFPGNNLRSYYLMTAADKDKWVAIIKEAIGYAKLTDFYEVKETIGKGKSGVVKTANHKKTGKRVAVKVMAKKEMTKQDIEL